MNMNMHIYTHVYLYINTLRGVGCVIWVKGKSAERNSKKRKARKAQKPLCII